MRDMIGGVLRVVVGNERFIVKYSEDEEERDMN
jgi:hypothetical protein